MKPRFFRTPADFRRWLEKNHEKAEELWVGFHKKVTGKPSLTWPGSVDEALCFGWIDGIRKSLNAESYVIRFTPRRPGSIWSAVNLRKAEQLIASNRMGPAGLRAHSGRDPKRAQLYSFEQRKTDKLGPDEEKQLRKNPRAWKFFAAQPPGYRHTAVFWIHSAKQEETRARRLKTLIEDSSAGLRIKPLRRT